jgi:glucosylceramidase
MFGQFMKFVKRGALRIFSDEGTKTFANAAVRNPDGSIVLVVANASGKPKQFKVVWNGLAIKPTLDARSVATYLWNPK